MAKTSLCRNPGRKASEPKNYSASEFRFSAAKSAASAILSFQVCYFPFMTWDFRQVDMYTHDIPAYERVFQSCL